MTKLFVRWTAPHFMLVAAVGLVLTTMALGAIARHTDLGASRLVEPAFVRSIDLRFEDMANGGIRVTAPLGALPQIELAPGQDGFVRVALRSLARDRRISGFGPELPFRLGQQEDGQLWLRDIATGRLLYLDAYGHTNAKSFARLLDPMRATP